MTTRSWWTAALAAALTATWVAPAARAALEEIPAHRAKQITDAAPEKPQAAPRQARRVLVFITPPHLMPKDPHKGYNIPYAACAMKTLGTKTGAFEPVVSDDVATFLPESLKTFDAVVLCNASGPWITPSDEAMERLKAHGDAAAVEALLKKSILDWLGGGRGVMAFHYAIGANRHWPEFHAMLGATCGGHPWNEEVGIRVEEPGHPLCKAFGGQETFRLAEEIFQFLDPYARDRLRVLLSIDTAATNMQVQWLRRQHDNDYALAWVKRHGQGRVFYTALGHRTEHFWNPMVLRFYLDGIQFACGDLEAPADPRPAAR